MSETLIEPDANDGDATVLELDELWSFVLKKTNQAWIWIAYQAVIPENQHTAAGKETGETAHVERWNNTLRQRLARFVRKTLSFSRISGDA